MFAAATPLFQIGTTIVLHPLQAFDRTELIDLVEREGIGSLFLVPAMWQAMVQVPPCSGTGITRRRPLLVSPHEVARVEPVARERLVVVDRTRT